MSDLNVSVILQAVDKMTAPVRQITKAAKNLGVGFDNVEKRYGELSRKTRQIDTFVNLKRKVNATNKEFTEATKKVGTLAREIANTSKPTKQLIRQFEQAKRRAALLKTEHLRQGQGLHKLRTSLKEAGISTRNLGEEQRQLKQQLDSVTRSMSIQQDASGSFRRLNNRVREVGGNVRNVAREVGSLGIKLTATAGIIGYVFKRQFVDTAAQFEKFQTVLETTEGSKEAAKEAMRWVSDFAARTPYELDQVNEAFVKLRAYGLDPTNGLLKTLGDTGAAMDKDIIQVVEAIADAVTGENERLKEFGVRAKNQKGTITYEYTSSSGLQKTLSVDANDRKAIEQALTEIFNEKYAGSMDKLSKTWDGMVSNVADQWTRFKDMVMEAGVFDFMKSKLQGLLDKINQLSNNGKLQEYAKSISDKLVAGMKAAWEFGKALVEVSSVVFGAIKTVADSVGGFKVLLGGIAALIAGNLIVSTVALGKSLVGLGVDSYSAAKDGLRFLIDRLKLMNASMAASLKNAVPSFIAGMRAAGSAARNFGKRGAKAAVAGAKAIKRSLIATSAATVTFAKHPITGALSGIKKLRKAMLGLANGAIKALIGGLRALKLTVAANPLGLLAIAVTAAAVAVYKYWDRIKAFASGVVEGFNAAAGPIKEAFKPLQPLFDAIGKVIGWVVGKVKALFAPVHASTEALGKAAAAGRKFGEWLADALDFALSPLKLLIEGIEWIVGNIDKIVKVANFVGDKVGGAWGAAKKGASSAWDAAKKGASSAWNWVLGDDEAPTKQIVKKVERAGKIIPFPKGGRASVSQQKSGYQPLIGAPPNINQTKVNTNITVHAAPGMSEKELARQIDMKLKDRERRAQAQQRGALYDYSDAGGA